MIQSAPLSNCFEDFEGPEQDMNAAIEHITGQYRTLLDEFCPGKDISVHIITARVRMDMKLAFNDVKDQIKAMEGR